MSKIKFQRQLIIPLIGGAFYASLFFWTCFLRNAVFFNVCYWCGTFFSLITVYDMDCHKMPKKLAFFMISNLFFCILYLFSSFLSGYYLRITIYGTVTKIQAIKYFYIISYLIASEILFLILFTSSLALFRKKRMKIKKIFAAEVAVDIISATLLIITVAAAININNTDALLWFTNLFRVVDCC